MTTKITCVVDYALKKPSRLLGEHGLSIWIETSHGSVLYDTGSTTAVLSNNLQQLGLSPGDITAVALSHGHNDHTGGLEYILSQAEGFPLYAHADIFRPRFAKRKNAYENIGMPLDREWLAQKVDLRLATDAVEILPNLWTAGAVTNRPEPEGGADHLLIQDGGDWQPDTYMDDLSLVLKTSRGLVLICGCCHAGLLNTLYHVEDLFEGPILAIMGGTHLVSAKYDYLVHLIEVFETRYPGIQFYLNHCTGENAFKQLSAALGSQVSAFTVGSVQEFAD